MAMQNPQDNDHVGLGWIIAGWVTTGILALIALCLAFHPVLVFGMQMPLAITTVLFVLMFLITLNNSVSGNITAQRNLRWLIGTILTVGIAIFVLWTLYRAYIELPDTQIELSNYISQGCPTATPTPTEGVR